MNTAETMRTTFADVASRLLVEDPSVAVVLADISAALFVDARRRHPDRVITSASVSSCW